MMLECERGWIVDEMRYLAIKNKTDQHSAVVREHVEQIHKNTFILVK